MRCNFDFVELFSVFSANTTSTSSDVENAINVQANKLLTDELTQSSTKEDVQNFLALAICTTIVGVSSSFMSHNNFHKSYLF